MLICTLPILHALLPHVTWPVASGSWSTSLTSHFISSYLRLNFFYGKQNYQNVQFSDSLYVETSKIVFHEFNFFLIMTIW
jgi:hypothetical protein